MTRYRAIHCKIWNHRHNCDLETMAVMMHLLTSPLTNRIGLYRASTRILADDIDLPHEQYERLWQRLPEGFVEIDNKRKIVFLPGWIKHNPPANPNVLKSWMRECSEIVDCELKSKWYYMVRVWAENNRKPFLKALSADLSLPESLCQSLSGQEQYQEQEKDQTPQTMGGEISSSKVDGQLETHNDDHHGVEKDVAPNIKSQSPNGQIVGNSQNAPAAQRIIAVLMELWPDLTEMLAEQYYMRIRSSCRDLDVEKFEGIIRKAWSKWPPGRSALEAGGLGSWVVREIDMVRKEERHESERQSYFEAKRSGAGGKKPDIHHSLARLEKDLQAGRAKNSRNVLSMSWIQPVVNEAAEDAISLPDIVAKWIDKGAQTGAFTLGESRKLIDYHLSSGTARELIAEPPPPMTPDEIKSHMAQLKIGPPSPPDTPESPEDGADGKARQPSGSLGSGELAELAKAKVRTRQMAAAQPQSSEPAAIGAMIQQALGQGGTRRS